MNRTSIDDQIRATRNLRTTENPRLGELRRRTIEIERQLSSIHGYLARGEADAKHALEVELGVTYDSNRGFQPLEPGCRCRLCDNC